MLSGTIKSHPISNMQIGTITKSYYIFYFIIKGWSSRRNFIKKRMGLNLLFLNRMYSLSLRLVLFWINNIEEKYFFEPIQMFFIIGRPCQHCSLCFSITYKTTSHLSGMVRLWQLQTSSRLMVCVFFSAFIYVTFYKSISWSHFTNCVIMVTLYKLC